MSVRVRRLLAFWRENGVSATVRLFRTKLGAAIAGRPVLNRIRAGSLIAGVAGPPGTVSDIVRFQFPRLQPLATYLIPKPSLPRVSLITDSIGSGSLFGGVGTALLFAAHLANRMNATLRVVTRTEVPSPKNVLQILGAYGIQLRHEVQFAFVPVLGDNGGAEQTDGAAGGLDIGPDETFVTTSWWTTSAALTSVPHASIIYLLQEDERMFYPFGEDRFQCEQVLRTDSIRFVVNTRLLFDHLVASGLPHLERNGLWFEPAFPQSLFRPRQNESGGKKRFFFYARPNNPRNLFHIGLEIIDRAINRGILDLAQWDVFLVGKDIPRVIFGDGYLPTQYEGLNWEAYADLAGTIDLGLCLMSTPHPSYPPLDLAASGAVVVTNKFGNKLDLSSYSQNIICADLDAEALLEALREGVALAQDNETRSRNFAANGLSGDWALSFENTLRSLATES